MNKGDEEFLIYKQHLETNYKVTFDKANDGVWCCRFGRFRFEMWINSESRWATCFMHADDRGTLLGTAYNLHPVTSFALALQRFHNLASDVPQPIKEDLRLRLATIPKNNEIT
jgi:hypothetical protein